MNDQYPSDEVIAAVQALVTKYGGEQVHAAYFKSDYYLEGVERERIAMEELNRKKQKPRTTSPTLHIFRRDSNGNPV